MLVVSSYHEYSSGFRVQVLRDSRSASREMLIEILNPHLDGEEVLFSVKMDTLSTDYEERTRSTSLVPDNILLASWQLLILKGATKSKPAKGVDENSPVYEADVPIDFEIEVILAGFSLNARFKDDKYPPIEFDVAFMDGAAVLHLEGEWHQELNWQDSDEDSEVF